MYPTVPLPLTPCLLGHSQCSDNRDPIAPRLPASIENRKSRPKRAIGQLDASQAPTTFQFLNLGRNARLPIARMSKAKARSHLLQLVDSDSEDGLGGIAAVRKSKSTVQKGAMPPTKKAKAGRQAANRVTKPAPAPKASTSKSRTSGRVAAAVDQSSNEASGAPAKGPGRGRGRKRAVDKEEEEEDVVMAEEPATPPAKQKAARGRPKKVVVEAAEPQPPAARRGRKPAAKKAEPDTTTEDVSEIPETQQPDLTLTDDDDDDDDHDDLEPSVEVGRGHVQIPSSVSKRPLHTLSSDNDGSALRRRLGEMNQKYESLELKYRDLKEVAGREAERNFDKLKQQSEEKSKGKFPYPPQPEKEAFH